MTDRDTEDFLITYLKELNEDNAAVFVGAGLSKAAGYVDWPGLLSPVAKALGLDATKSLIVALAQYHLNANATNRHRLNSSFSSMNSLTSKIRPKIMRYSRDYRSRHTGQRIMTG